MEADNQSRKLHETRIGNIMMHIIKIIGFYASRNKSFSHVIYDKKYRPGQIVHMKKANWLKNQDTKSLACILLTEENMAEGLPFERIQ